MEFAEIFRQFLEYHDRLKVVFVGSSDENGQPNCVPKMLIDIVKPNKVFYIDFKFSRTYANVNQNWQSSLAFMDDKTFIGFKLTGFSQVIDSGREFMLVKEKWTQKVISYEADRMIERIKGIFSGQPPAISLPDDYAIIKFIAEEAAIVKPDRVLKAIKNTKQEISTSQVSHPIKKIVELQTELTRHIRAQKRFEERERTLERTSVEDHLTGLYNRRGFIALVEQQLKIAKRNGKKSFLIFSDLDRLKPINDAFGHQTGDRAIVDAARILKKTFRESDIVGRVGGDEFAIAVIDCGQKDLERVTGRLKQNIERYNYEKQAPYVLDLSVGVAACGPDESASLEELLNRADRRMYEEKEKKKAVG